MANVGCNRLDLNFEISFLNFAFRGIVGSLRSKSYG